MIIGQKFLKIEEVKVGDKLTFVDSGFWAESRFKKDDGSKKNELNFTVLFKGEERVMKLNKLSQDNLIPSFGKQTDSWPGKSAAVKELALLPNGKRMIVLTPIDGGGAVQDSQLPPVGPPASVTAETADDAFAD